MAELRTGVSGSFHSAVRFEDLQVGDTGQIERRFGKDDLLAFSQLVGDDNPLHLDEEFAAGTRFGRCIVHGPLYSSLIGTVLATMCPGPGTILLSQNYRYIRPLFVDQAVIARVMITDVDFDTGSISLSVECCDEDGRKVLDGSVVARVAR